MRLFHDRTDLAYRLRIEGMLNLDGPDGLVETALTLPEPIRTRGREYHKTVAIDFFGFCGTTLFDRGQVVASNCLFDQLSKLANEAESLNLRGIIVRFRVLFVYPYSVAGQNRIHAEMNRLRGSIAQPKFHRGSRLMEHLCEDSFQRSSLVTTLDRVIGVVEDWRQELGHDHPFLTHPNRFDVRFICVNPFVCGLRINQHFFYDSYMLAKQDRFASRCPNDLAPLIELDGALEADQKGYHAFCDHFRFLLDHDATMDYRDAVHTESNSPRLLSPDQVAYLETARRVLRFEKRERDPRAIREYTMNARQKLLQLCPPVRQFQTKEVAFIACSWHGTPGRPIAEAEVLQRLLRRDFDTSAGNDAVTKTASSMVDVRVVIAQPGTALSESVYQALNEATLGIVILSPELKEERDGRTTFSARPNVYHELGYLMGKIPRGRVLVFRHSSVDSPSNVGDLVHMRYDADRIQLAYTELLVSLSNLGLFSSRVEFERVMKRHLNSLRSEVLSKKITHEEFDWALNVAKGQGEARPNSSRMEESWVDDEGS